MKESVKLICCRKNESNRREARAVQKFVGVAAHLMRIEPQKASVSLPKRRGLML
jgi:hypothetical protein